MCSKNLKVQVEQDTFIIFLDRRYSGILKTEGDEVSALGEVFWQGHERTIRDVTRQEKFLDDFVKEADLI